MGPGYRQEGSDGLQRYVRVVGPLMENVVNYKKGRFHILTKHEYCGILTIEYAKRRGDFFYPVSEALI